VIIETASAAAIGIDSVVARFMPTMCRAVEIASKNPGGMKAATAHPVMQRMTAAPLRCQGSRRRRSAISATAAIASHNGTRP
jgi:hypothetical protein